jgi:ubiquinone/menaquinone biosynthesis C-methylase UbiE
MKRTVTLLVALGISGGCSWLKRTAYEGFGRDGWQQSERVIQALALRPGDRVGDLGSGSGYFTLPLARAVGPAGRVYAVDVDEQMNRHLSQRLARAGLGNVEVILGRVDDPLLPDRGVDLVLVADTYHHLADRPAYFRNLRRDLTANGRVAVIDFDRRSPWYMRWLGHFTPREDLLREMAQAGYEPAQEFDFIDRQSFVIFRPLP